MLNEERRNNSSLQQLCSLQKVRLQRLRPKHKWITSTSQFPQTQPFNNRVTLKFIGYVGKSRMPLIVKYSNDIPKGYVGLSKTVMEALGIQEDQKIKIVLTRPKPLVPPGEFKLRAIKIEIPDREAHVNPSLKWKSLQEWDKVEISKDVSNLIERSFLFP